MARPASPTACCGGSRDFAEVRGDGTIDAATARAGLAVFGVDERGLDKVDRAVLVALCRQFHGGPVGLSTLAIAVGEQPETVEDMYEPFLIQQGLLARTPRGRVAMPAAYDHLGLARPTPTARRPPNLFDHDRVVGAVQLQVGRCSARKAIVLAHAARAAASS